MDLVNLTPCCAHQSSRTVLLILVILCHQREKIFHVVWPLTQMTEKQSKWPHTTSHRKIIKQSAEFCCTLSSSWPIRPSFIFGICIFRLKYRLHALIYAFIASGMWCDTRCSMREVMHSFKVVNCHIVHVDRTYASVALQFLVNCSMKISCCGVIEMTNGVKVKVSSHIAKSCTWVNSILV